MDIQKEIEFFDKFEGEHGDYDVLDEGAYRRLLDMFEKMIEPRAGERCADLGCGTGAFTRRLKRFGLDLTGVDISPNQVARANAAAGPGERYVVGDIRDSKLPEGTFDIVVYSGVLHHCDTPESRIAVLQEGCRLLRRGGRIYAYDPSVESPSMFLYRDPRSPLHSTKGKTDNEVLLHRRELAAELRTAGFSDVVIRGVSGITFRYVESPLARVMLSAYNAYEHLVRFSPFENRLGTFLLTTAKRP
jgi:SAM-dependent methyltransferase